MAKTPANKKDKTDNGNFEEALWDAANKLRGSVESFTRCVIKYQNIENKETWLKHLQIRTTI